MAATSAVASRRAAAAFYSLAALGGTMDPPDFEDIEKRADAKIDNLPMYSIAFYSATLPPYFGTFHRLCTRGTLLCT